jgi:hypothetical protein
MARLLGLSKIGIAEVIAVRNGFMDFDNMSVEVLDVLMEYFMEDMPYGTAKARDGDPYEWICNRLVNMSAVEFEACIKEAK